MSKTMLGKGPLNDRRLLLMLAGLVFLAILLVTLMAPATAANDPRPSSYNAAPGGAKASFLTLQALGRPVARWEQPLDDLPEAEAAHTTLILPEPLYSALEKDHLAAAVERFLQHGGRLLTTGASGALLIPGGKTGPSHRLASLCNTEPEGPGSLAQAGKVEMQDTVRWAADAAPGSTLARVEQRCGPDAVVVRLPAGKGEAIWWSSPSPLTNAELHLDPDLKLLLASVGPGRRVLFDESLQLPVRSKWTAARGLPLSFLLAQTALIFALLVFSFSRRRGPVRLPLAVPRSSPLEFARSMGHLYERAGATDVAVAAAKRRLERILVREGGLPRRLIEDDLVANKLDAKNLVDNHPSEIASALAARFGGNWDGVSQHLRDAANTDRAGLRVRAALLLVRALWEEGQRILMAANLPSHPPSALFDDTDPAAESAAGLPSPYAVENVSR